MGFGKEGLCHKLLVTRGSRPHQKQNQCCFHEGGVLSVSELQPPQLCRKNPVAICAKVDEIQLYHSYIMCAQVNTYINILLPEMLEYLLGSLDNQCQSLQIRVKITSSHAFFSIQEEGKQSKSPFSYYQRASNSVIHSKN